MTREEIREFIKRTIIAEAPFVVGADDVVDDNIISAIDIIVGRWEEDVEENRDAAYQEGIHIGQESV